MGMTKKLKNYVKDNRPKKLKSYLSSHGIEICDVKLGWGQNLLHYCARHGSAEMLRCLLRLECDPALQDRDGNLPLHIALHRGMEEDVTQAGES